MRSCFWPKCPARGSPKMGECPVLGGVPAAVLWPPYLCSCVFAREKGETHIRRRGHDDVHECIQYLCCLC